MWHFLEYYMYFFSLFLFFIKQSPLQDFRWNVMSFTSIARTQPSCRMWHNIINSILPPGYCMHDTLMESNDTRHLLLVSIKWHSSGMGSSFNFENCLFSQVRVFRKNLMSDFFICTQEMKMVDPKILRGEILLSLFSFLPSDTSYLHM